MGLVSDAVQSEISQRTVEVVQLMSQGAWEAVSMVWLQWGQAACTQCCQATCAGMIKPTQAAMQSIITCQVSKPTQAAICVQGLAHQAGARLQ
jgi:hypothetical protein